MATAFIPARGGSKSIPLKNIKPFCGKPLIYWSLKALESVLSVDKIIVATDSDNIEKTVKEFSFEKVVVYKRDSANATDEASTESVILEYLSNHNLSNDELFLLVQATSPLSRSIDYQKAIEHFNNDGCDSLLSCVRTKRFFWRADGTPLNYDYRSRPRRQDFDGLLMENGAFYINKVGNIIRDKNRLSGRISIYEMPDYTAVEIDDETDWIIAETLMQKHRLFTGGSEYSIKLFLSDVDGTLTDAGMYYDQTGNEMKKFNTRDGKGFELLRKKNIKTGIITSETTEIVKRRAEKIKLDYEFQGIDSEGKLKAAIELCNELNIHLENVAYIGDDINCIELLKKVGIAACPADAVPDVKKISGINIMNSVGGSGAVREFIDMLLKDN